MPEMRIGEVSRRTGVPTSTLRYYEKEALLEPPARASGQRLYAQAVLGRIAVVKLALSAGFSIAETRLFISGFASEAGPAQRWRELAQRKLVELDRELDRVITMKAVLEASFQCECPSLDICEGLISKKRQCSSEPGQPELR